MTRLLTPRSFSRNISFRSINCLWLSFACLIISCSVQNDSQAIVRKSFDSPQRNCHVELLVDKETGAILLGYVLLNKNQSFSEVDLKTKDGPIVSVTNVYFHAPGRSSFGFGSGWNRSTEEVVIDSIEFNRKSGDIFLLVDEGSDKKTLQLAGDLKFTDIMTFISDLRDKNDEEHLVDHFDSASKRLLHRNGTSHSKDNTIETGDDARPKQ